MGLRTALRAWLVPGIMLAAALLVAAAGDRARLALRYDRAALEAGELYRLLTGHFAHLGWSHLALNAIGLALTFVLVGSAFSAAQWLFVILTSVMVMDLGFWFLLPELGWYVGLSGVLHGILVAGAIRGIRKGSPEQALILVVVLVKLGYEAVVGPLPGSEGSAGGPVVTEAHMLGAIGGAMAAGLLIIGNRSRAPI